MSIQEEILNEIPKETKQRLIQSQINEANAILFKRQLKIKRHVLTSVPIDHVIPSQEGEDYENPSSKYDSETFVAVRDGIKTIQDIRLDVFRPIAVNEDTMEIIDGNHRHYATKASGEKDIYVLLCELERIHTHL